MSNQQYESNSHPQMRYGAELPPEYKESLYSAVAAALESLSTQDLAAMPFGGCVYVLTDGLPRTPSVEDIIIMYSRGGPPHPLRIFDGRIAECVASFSYALMDIPAEGASEWEVEASEHPFILDFLLLDRSQLLSILLPYARVLVMSLETLPVPHVAAT